MATPETEAELVEWARCVAPGAIRHRAELEAHKSAEEIRSPDRDRMLRYWHLEGGRRLGLTAEMPAAEGAVVVRALERKAAEVPRCRTRPVPFTTRLGWPTRW